MARVFEPDGVFQFTPLREGRLLIAGVRPFSVPISIHAPPRGATNEQKRPAAARIFQFTPLREGRLHPRRSAKVKKAISIHAPPRGATRRVEPDSQLLFYFNSRPSARGDGRDENAFSPPDFISIHAPPRGATDGCGGGGVKKSISIHAPPRGATHSLLINAHAAQFQFTPLREGRQNPAHKA